MEEEMDSLRKNKTWELVDHPAGQKLVSCKWLFKIKEGIEGVQKPSQPRLGIGGLMVYAGATRFKRQQVLDSEYINLSYAPGVRHEGARGSKEDSWYGDRQGSESQITEGFHNQGGHFKLLLKDWPVKDCDVERMRYLANPGKNHWRSRESGFCKIFCGGTGKCGFGDHGTNRGNHVDVTGFVDSDYAKDPDKDRFTMKQKNGKNPGETIEITVFDYYLKHRDTELKESRNLPCLDVGKPKRPVYIPLEFCELISLQRYTKSLSNLQRASLVEKSRQKPHDRMKTLMGALNQSNYNADPLINSTGITISTTFTEVQGRVLEPPKLKFGNGGDLLPRGGRWNYNNKTLVEPKQIKCWAIVNFSARCDIPHMCTDLLRCSGAKGMLLDDPYTVIQENYQDRRFPAPVRVEKMFEAIKSALPGPPVFLLCILPERKNSDIYGFALLLDLSIPEKFMDGINSLLSVEYLRSIPLVSRTPTIIFGMDVSHGSPGRSDVPSIAAIRVVLL
ncbi:argonaute 4A-like protein [Tanacetum coccineum]